MSYLRALFFTDPLLIGTTIFMGSVSMGASLFDPHGELQDRVARRWARALLRISGVKLRLSGLERLDCKRNYVFVGNHLSLMDTPVALGGIPNRFRFLAASKYFQIPFLGTHLRRAGHFPVVTGDAKASLRSMSEAARYIQERRLSVLLFPEGGRSTDGMREFKEGAAYIAIKAAVPVVPMAIIGTREVLPVGSIHVKGGTVELRFGEPIETAGMTVKDRAELTRQMRQRIESLLAGSGLETT